MDAAGPLEPLDPAPDTGRLMVDIERWYRCHYRPWIPLTEAELQCMPTTQSRLAQTMAVHNADSPDQGRLRQIIRNSHKVWSVGCLGEVPVGAKAFVCCMINPHARQNVPAEQPEHVPFVQHSVPERLNTGVMQVRLDMPGNPNPPANRQYGLCRQILIQLRGRNPPAPHAEVDHKCGRRFCVNPYHLTWSVSRFVNMRRQFCPGRIMQVRPSGRVRYYRKCLCGAPRRCRFIRVIKHNEGSGRLSTLVSNSERHRG